jgi:hypothetical protein
MPNLDVKKTFETFDKLDRQEFAEKLTKAISTFYNFHNESYVLSLNAKFGAGKTTFLQMWRNELEKEDYKVIFINAWETDFENEPILPIVSEILNEIENKSQNEKNLNSALWKSLGILSILGNIYVEKKFGIELKNLKEVEKLLKKDENLQKTGEILYKEYSFKKQAYMDLRNALGNFIENSKKKPLIILVDELDRVRPDYAVSFLEAIKHIFSVQGICFVLAVNREQLEKSVNQLYGNIDFENYYRRFVTSETSLPELSTDSLDLFIASLSTEFFKQRKNKDFSFPYTESTFTLVQEFLVAVCRVFDFFPREIQSLFRAFTQFMAISEAKENGVEFWVKSLIILLAVKVKNPSVYNKIGQGNFSAKQLLDFIEGLNLNPKYQNDDRQLMMIALASMLRREYDQFQIEEWAELADVSMRYVLFPNQKDFKAGNNNDREAAISTLDNIKGVGFGLEPFSTLPVFQQIHMFVEEWDQFVDE